MYVILLCQGILLRNKPETSEPFSIPQVVKEMRASDPKAKGPRSPPSALKKRMERLNSLPDQNKHPVTVYKDGAIAKLKFGLAPEDQQIADRLQNLKGY